MNPLQVEKTRKSVEASCREMEEAAARADRALASLEMTSRDWFFSHIIDLVSDFGPDFIKFDQTCNLILDKSAKMWSKTELKSIKLDS